MTPCRFFGSWIAALATAALLTACSEKPQSLSHDAYVWQRRWQAPVANALLESADLVQTWRILAAEVDARGRFRRIPVDLAAVAASGRPAIPVVRIEVPLASLEQTALIADIAALQAAWRTSPAGAAGLEIDHDCATRQLGDYARFLEALRPALAPDLPLSATLLPDWLGAQNLGRILAAADETVLQLHSVLNPSGALFDPASAEAWTSALVRQAGKPFRIALPDYGSRVVTNASGRIEAVESETPVEHAQADGKELFAAPAAVATFLRRLEKRAPSRLVGIVWFRLPVAGDQRAWTPATWRAVISGRELSVRFGSQLQDSAGVQTLILRNDGEIDGTLPASLVAEAPCRGISGQNGYVFEQWGQDSVFVRSQKALFRAGSQIAVATMECPRLPARIHIEHTNY